MQQGNQTDWINTTEAMRLVEEENLPPTTRTTIIEWIKKYGIGKKIGGRWYVDKAKLKWYLKYGGEF